MGNLPLPTDAVQRPPHYDPAPLLRFAANAAAARIGRSPFTVDGHAPDSAIAALLGCSKRSVLRWRHGEHQLRSQNADRFATLLGLHPCEIWPEWFA